MEQAKLDHPGAVHYRFLRAAFIAISVALLGVLGLVLVHRGPAQNLVTRLLLLTSIEAKTMTLDSPRRSVELTSEKALRVRRAIKEGDYATARRITAAVLAQSHIENWRYYPFGDFINDISDVSDPVFEERLSEWVARNGSDAIPVLLRSQYYFDKGRFARGHDFIRAVTAANLTSFGANMQKALVDAEAAIRLDDSNPYGFYLRLRILHGFRPSAELKRDFEEAIAKYPDYYPLYDIVLATLEPRWGGTVPAMYGFVDQYGGPAPVNSPLKLLYVSLYRDLLGSGAAACADNWHDSEKMDQCVALEMERTAPPALEQQVLSALALYDRTDKHQFDLAIENILSDMLRTSGGDTYAGAVLQLAASSMHSNTQLKDDVPVRNDYVVDKVVAQSWFQKGFYDNALTKDQEAVKDAEAAEFPSEEEKDIAIARIYKATGEVYSKLHQYADVITYEKAAVALGGKSGDEHYICFAYYQLKDYEDALQSCSTTLQHEPDNLSARYWRGMTYRASGKNDAALQDLTIIADSQSGFRTYAAIEISMIYFDRHDVAGQLSALNRYTYLYDPDVASKETMSVGYNNRCYAYMQLGELKKAFDDCTASLKYGSLPDAYRKQQELVKRLAVHETGL